MSLTIALDVDNTLANFTDGFARFLHRDPTYADRHFPAHTFYDLVRSGWFSSPAEFTRTFSEAESAGLYLTLTPFTGALDALHELTAQGHRFIIVTARSSSYYSDTLRWLTTYGVRFEQVIHTDNKAAMDADLFVEDADYQIVNLLAAGKRVVAHDRPYNSALAVDRFTGWAELPKLVERVSRAVLLPR